MCKKWISHSEHATVVWAGQGWEIRQGSFLTVQEGSRRWDGNTFFLWPRNTHLDEDSVFFQFLFLNSGIQLGFEPRHFRLLQSNKYSMPLMQEET